MYKICVFGGTTEGRDMVDFLSENNISTTVCVATDYGKSLIPENPNLKVIAKRQDSNEMRDLFEREKFDLVIDSTHPYAVDVTQNIQTASKSANIKYIRLIRKKSDENSHSIYFNDIQEVVEYLNSKDGKILLTTGSKEIGKYTGIKDFEERVYARVLPMISSIKASNDAGLSPSHIIALQGPFSEQMNTLILRHTGARFMVTKDTGSVGGFEDKEKAAQNTGAKLLVIGRPVEEEGYTYEEIIRKLEERLQIKRKPAISIVGIGVGSRENLTYKALDAIEKSDLVVGARRMIDSVADGKKCQIAIDPKKILEIIKDNHHLKHISVLMSGDVGFFSGTKKLLPLLKSYDVSIQSGISSMAYLCGKIGISYDDMLPVSLHGRDVKISPIVRANEKVFALVGGDSGINNLCQELIDASLADVDIYVGQRLGYSDEKILLSTPEKIVNDTFDNLSVAVIINKNMSQKTQIGIKDEYFTRNDENSKTVPMTKSEIRSIIISKLQLQKDSICYDVGAGTGSVSVEMAIQSPYGTIYAVEKNKDAIELIHKNKAKFHLSNIEVVAGKAPDVCTKLLPPSHVFIGGSTGNFEDILKLVLDKNPNARIVSTAVSLEAIGQMIETIKKMGFSAFETVSVQIAKNQKIGRYNLMKGQNPIYIFTFEKGGDSPC